MSTQCDEYRSYQQNKPDEAKCQQYIMGIHKAFFSQTAGSFGRFLPCKKWKIQVPGSIDDTGCWLNRPGPNNISSQFYGPSHFARLNNARIVLNHQPDCFSSFGFSWAKTLLIISSRSSSSYPMPSVRLDFVCWVLTHF